MSHRKLFDFEKLDQKADTMSEIAPITENNNNSGAKMIEQNAVVLSTKGGFAYVEALSKDSNCQSCSASNGSSKCSVLSLSSFFAQRQKQTMKVQNLVYAKAGEQVVIGIQGNAFIVYSLLAYLLPLVTMTVFAAVGMEIFAWLGLNADLGAFFAAIGGVITGLRLGNRLASLSKHFDEFRPVILRKHAQEARPLIDLASLQKSNISLS